jgi:hypothetical protein
MNGRSEHMSEVRKMFRPHPADLGILRRSVEIYSRTRTPEVTHDGRLTELDLLLQLRMYLKDDYV